MIHLVSKENIHLYAQEMEAVFRLRHRVFVDEMNWNDLRKADEREMDQFDDEHCIHMLAISENEVVGYQRMLPSTRPHLLSTVMPELCEGERPVGQNIWEWTRYCVLKQHRERGRSLSPIANQLLSAIVEWGLAREVNTIIIEMDPLWLLRLVQLHFRVMPLGLPVRLNDKDVIAVQAVFDRRTLAKLREMRGDERTALVSHSTLLRKLVG